MFKNAPIIERITGEGPWRYMGSNGRFIISPATTQYTLNYSADGKLWTAWPDETPANESLLVIDAATGMFFKCVGLSSTEKISVTY